MGFCIAYSAGVAIVFLRSLEISMGSEIRNFSLKSEKFFESYLGSTGMILERSKIVRGECRLRDDLEDELDEPDEVGPSPALLLKKPLPRARVRPTDTADKLGIGSDLGMPIAMEHQLMRS